MKDSPAGILASPWMTPVPAQILLAIALLSACPRRTAAQPVLPIIVSVDAAVLNAEYVFVGRIERLLTNGSTASVANVVAKVETRLKGEVSDVTQTLIAAPESSLAEWTAGGNRLLFIHGANPIDLSASNLMVLTAQSAVLRQPEQIIQAARDAIRHHPGVTRITTCLKPLPPELAMHRPFGGGTALVVPADEAVKKWALRGLRSRAPYKRSQGAEALRHFPPDANAARLRALLADPAFVLCRDAPGDKERKFYLVRKSAYDTLMAWGLKPEQPEFYKETLDLPGETRARKARAPNLYLHLYASSVYPETPRLILSAPVPLSGEFDIPMDDHQHLKGGVTLRNGKFFVHFQGRLCSGTNVFDDEVELEKRYEPWPQPYDDKVPFICQPHFILSSNPSPMSFLKQQTAAERKAWQRENPLTARQLAEVKRKFYLMRAGMTKAEVFAMLGLSDYENRLLSSPFLSHHDLRDYQLADGERLMLFFDNTGNDTNRIVVRAELDSVAWSNSPSVWRTISQWP